jgi:hypothetical protein
MLKDRPLYRITTIPFGCNWKAACSVALVAPILAVTKFLLLLLHPLHRDGVGLARESPPAPPMLHRPLWMPISFSGTPIRHRRRPWCTLPHRTLECALETITPWLLYKYNIKMNVPQLGESRSCFVVMDGVVTCIFASLSLQRLKNRLIEPRKIREGIALRPHRGQEIEKEDQEDHVAPKVAIGKELGKAIGRAVGVH